MSRSVEEIRSGHRRKRTLEIFELMDRGLTMDQAAEVMTRRRETGANSEEAFLRALDGYPGIGAVRQASIRSDYVKGVDMVVVTKPPLFVGDWRVQIKSNDKDCREYLTRLKPEYRAKTIYQVKLRMAKNGRMLINAGRYRDDEMKNRESIRDQFNVWLELSAKARLGNIR